MFKPTFTDISNWEKIAYASTGGTRAKKIYVHPDEDVQYFFKGSKKLKDGTFKYTSEFWSEIVSSKIGQMLSFDMLDYNIAYDLNDEQKIGCLSKSMINHTENKLAEGIDYLRGFNPRYNPKLDEDHYTLDFIVDTLSHFKLENSIPAIIEMIIFDAIIGNSDRHQENWAFITYFKEAIDLFDKEIGRKDSNIISRNIMRFYKWLIKKIGDESIHQSHIPNIGSIIPTAFSPIYDSGCSLGRENLEEKISKMLLDSQMMDAYITRKGKAEIRCEVGGKPTHFELLEYVKKKYHIEFCTVQNRIKDKFSMQDLRGLIENIDDNLPETLSKFKLKNYRKKFMIKVVTLRIEKIVAL